MPGIGDNVGMEALSANQEADIQAALIAHVAANPPASLDMAKREVTIIHNEISRLVREIRMTEERLAYEVRITRLPEDSRGFDTYRNQIARMDAELRVAETNLRFAKRRVEMAQADVNLAKARASMAELTADERVQELVA